MIFSRTGIASYFIGDEEVTEAEFRTRFPDKELGSPEVVAPGIWPMESLASAVHPKQVDEANARNKNHGIAATYKPDGTCVIQDRAARKQLNALEGFHDKQGGYGD